MVNRNLIRGLDLSEQEWEQEMAEALDGADASQVDWGGSDVRLNQIITGRVLRVEGDHVLLDVGYKCEGTVPLHEWEDSEEPPQPGDTVKVLVQQLEDLLPDQIETSLISLSKRQAARIEGWRKVMETVHVGDVVTGPITRKIKGGLLVDIGVQAFLPASQIDVRRVPEIGDLVGRTIQCMVMQIDEERRNIIVSRRTLIETERDEKKSKLLAELEVGQRRKGIVKNLAAFGAFVDLGGMDGLLHISDMSWSRTNHPSEVVAIDQEIEVQILHIDREREKIALGLKQLTASPWESVAGKYPVGTRVKGKVLNLMTYGAFVELESGVEGLVHISEMSWTKRIAHPSELMQPNDEVEVVVLAINHDKHEISLGMKQTQENPWDKAMESYPPGTIVTGRVRNLTNYGAFVEIVEGLDGLLHVSDMSWTRKIGHPAEMVENGQTIECKVLSVDPERRRIALGLKQLQEDLWAEYIPNKYEVGKIVSGTVTKLTNFGVFVSLEESLEGLVHISELADATPENLDDLVKVGDVMELKVLRVDSEDRKIGLSRKQVLEPANDSSSDNASPSTNTAPAVSNRELKGGVGGGGPLFTSPTPAEPDHSE